MIPAQRPPLQAVEQDEDHAPDRSAELRGPAPIDAFTYDLSIGGARLQTVESFEVGTLLRLQIELVRTQRGAPGSRASSGGAGGTMPRTSSRWASNSSIPAW